MNPEKNYYNVHKRLLDEIHENKIKINLLEQEVQKCKEYGTREKIGISDDNKLDERIDHKDKSFNDKLPPGTSIMGP